MSVSDSTEFTHSLTSAVLPWRGSEEFAYNYAYNKHKTRMKKLYIVQVPRAAVASNPEFL